MLRQRAAALYDPSGLLVRHRRTCKADRVDPEVVVEAAVLHRQQCVDEMGRHLREGNRFGHATAAMRERLTVNAVENEGPVRGGLERLE